jgi:hypothetical protein
MKTFTGGTAVAAGYYLHVRTWAIVPVASDGETLAGTGNDRYRRVSTPAALLLTPILGLLFVVFMPLIGFVLTAHAATTRREPAAAPIQAEIEPS